MGEPATASARFGNGPRALSSTIPCESTKTTALFGDTVIPHTTNWLLAAMDEKLHQLFTFKLHVIFDLFGLDVLEELVVNGFRSCWRGVAQ